MLPYVSLYLQRDLQWPPWRVGLVQGLRPWVSAPCGLLLCALADRFGLHRALLVACYAGVTLLRGALGLVPATCVGGVAALLLVAEAVGAPVGTIADASVVARCRSDGDYGKQR